ncbi:MAG: hypothetical protein HOP29_01305 [Phycisphaerales bacterium]|nr:hypothetical protein [Phycisphaerales bacterium]
MQRAVRLFAIGAAIFSGRSYQATTLQLNPDLDIQGQGVTYDLDGVGLYNLGAGTESLTVTVNGPLLEAVLYWAGREHPCVEIGADCVINSPHQDQEIVFDGNPLTGVLTGHEINDRPSGRNNNIGYKADVTDIVQAYGVGTHTFNIQDGDLANNFTNQFSGAALFVVYEDPSDPTYYRLMGFEGLDFAFVNGMPAAAVVTSPVLFNHGAASSARSATVNVLVGDCEPDRPDVVRISNHPDELGTLDRSDGPEWDTDGYGITIPGGVATTSVQIISPPTVGVEGDSLLWQFAVMRVTVPVCDHDCTANNTACESYSCDPDGAPGNCDVVTQTVNCSLNNTACVTFACDPAGLTGNCDVVTPTVDCSVNNTACQTFACDPSGTTGNCSVVTPTVDCSTINTACTTFACDPLGAPANCAVETPTVNCAVNNTACESFSCDPDGATGNCDVVMPTVNCSTLNTACDTFACNPSGAAGNCSVVTPTVTCSTNNTACETFACNPTGAPANCSIVTPTVNCTANNTACQTFTCNPTGAPGNCSVVTNTVNCSALNTVCKTFSCNPIGLPGNCGTITPNTGVDCNDGDACSDDDVCRPNGQCLGSLISGCGEIPAVPTVTHWGLVLMGLLGIIGGTVLFGRRTSTVRST